MNWLFTDVFMSVGLACLVCGLVVRELGRPPQTEVRPNVLRWLGQRSYSLYLLHFFIIASVFDVYCRLRGVQDKDSTAGEWANFIPILGGIVLAIWLSHWTFMLIEKPSHELGRKYARRFAKQG